MVRQHHRRRSSWSGKLLWTRRSLQYLNSAGQQSSETLQSSSSTLVAKFTQQTIHLGRQPRNRGTGIYSTATRMGYHSSDQGTQDFTLGKVQKQHVHCRSQDQAGATQTGEQQ